MTFNNAPWAVDGARTTGALARLATYATGGGRSGIVKPTDLRVLPLTVPGNGLRISSGGAMVLNHYLLSPDEAYVASNPAIHTVISADMPPSNPSLSYYLVCVVVGDPEFDQTGHPFMPSDVAPEDAADFEYVRIVLVPCTSSTTQFEQLGLHYPAYALARLAIPPSTTTITSDMITDLRELSQAREQRKVIAGAPTAGVQLTAADWTGTWVDYKPYINIPPWATDVTITLILSGFVAFGDNLSNVRPRLGTFVGTSVAIDENASPGGERRVYIAVSSGSVGAMAGTSQQLSIEAFRYAELGYLSTWDGCQVAYDVQFSERAS
jgi:hypothetical protein